MVLIPDIILKYHLTNSPGEAVCGAQDELLSYQGSSTDMRSITLQTGHPWPHTCRRQGVSTS